MIAFGLVGGKKDQATGKRVPMTVKEVTKLYQEVIPKIFKKAKNGKGWIDWGLKKKGSIAGTPTWPYTQKFLKLAVDEKFGTALTEDIGRNGCLAAAVARQFNEDPTQPDLLEIFDSQSDPAQLVSEVLLGSSDAPIYFETPSKIGHRNYIDGGVAGNIFPSEQIFSNLEQMNVWMFDITFYLYFSKAIVPLEKPFHGLGNFIRKPK